MRRRQMTQRVLEGLFLVVLLLASCSSPSDNGAGGGCGGSEASVNCLNVTRIVPTYLDTATTNVDAQRDQCLDQTGVVTGIEPFGDHNALVTLVNQQFPTSTSTDRAFDIGIIGYSVTYRLNQPCPAAARGCPPLTTLTSAESITIPVGQTVAVTLPFVPLSTKQEYVRLGGELGSAPPSYSATYTFTAQTIGVNDTFTVQGSAQFTITDFNNCP